MLLLGDKTVLRTLYQFCVHYNEIRIKIKVEKFQHFREYKGEIQISVIAEKIWLNSY